MTAKSQVPLNRLFKEHSTLQNGSGFLNRCSTR